MNTPRAIRFAFSLTGLLLLLAGHPLNAASTNTPVTVNTNDFRSIFENAGGRDPFFPNSTRQGATVSESGESRPAIVLALKGFSGNPGRRMAIINDRTFAVGEENEVLTAGGRVRVRCLEIQADVAIVTIGGGPKIELRLPPRF